MLEGRVEWEVRKHGTGIAEQLLVVKQFSERMEGGRSVKIVL